MKYRYLGFIIPPLRNIQNTLLAKKCPIVRFQSFPSPHPGHAASFPGASEKRRFGQNIANIILCVYIYKYIVRIDCVTYDLNCIFIIVMYNYRT